MRSAMTLTLPALAFLTQGCAGLNALSVRPDPLPQNVAEDCPRAQSFLRGSGSVGDDEATILSMGLALNECGDEKAIAVGAYGEVTIALNGGALPQNITTK